MTNVGARQQAGKYKSTHSVEIDLPAVISMAIGKSTDICSIARAWITAYHYVCMISAVCTSNRNVKTCLPQHTLCILVTCQNVPGSPSVYRWG